MEGMSALPGRDPMEAFSAVTRDWFTAAFAAPTEAQVQAWAAIGKGENTLVVAPTGSGKTLAAFLWALDRLASGPTPSDAERQCRVLYISPLKALAVDIERNLRAPLTGIRHTAQAMGSSPPDIQVAVRTGDSSPEERRRLATRPPDILITTPESLFLLLTSKARDVLRGVDTVIVDEVHALAGSKRGAHLALSLERLDALEPGRAPAQRIGLSATVRPAEVVASFLGGARPVTVAAPPSSKRLDLRIVVPVEDMTDLETTAGPETPDGQAPRRSIWPHVEERVLDLIEQHRSTIVFANSRRLAERLCARLNELAAERAELRAGGPAAAPAPPAQIMAQAGATGGAPPEVARAHHGSVSRQERAQIEEALKAGRLPAVVATSSLELGIDMGAVDLVVQVESPPSVASGLQRTGRAGHNVGDVSRGVIFPKYQGDLVQAAVVARRMRAGQIEELSVPRNPLDVLAQQIVAMTAMDDWAVGDLEQVIRRAAPFASLTRPVLEAVLDMLAGRYPSEEFAELRPRLVWDRITDTLHGRPGAQRLAVTSGGTIPDRGLFGVFLAASQREANGRNSHRVGELDEEMVYESRVGDIFVLGASSWRIEDITADQVLVSPAPGQPGKLPFWHGDAPGRPVELGRALGAYCRELAGATEQDATGRLRADGLDELAAANLVRYLADQREATGYVPDDRTLVLERFRDELGDWRLVLHSPFGAPVHAPWALAIAARLRERYQGMDVQAMHTDDGIVIRVPDTDEPPPAGLAELAPEDVEQLVTAELGNSALFASRFRECAARALLLPRRTPGRRSPLWQQRQRSAQLLSVARKYGTFPIVLETVRECLQDVFDVPGLVGLMRELATRQIRLVEVETATPSPFGRSMLFRYVGAFMYEGDAPVAERRAQALALDSALLAELLGQADLRELLDPAVVAETERELQRLLPSRACRDAEGVADLLRGIGPLSAAEVAERCQDPGAADGWLASLLAQRRALQIRVAGEARWAAIEDAGRLRDALGVPLPPGVPAAFTEPVADPLGDLTARYARGHAPFTTADVAARYGLGVAVITGTLRRLAAEGRVAEGEFLPGRRGTQWCDTGVLRLLRRRCLAKLRKEAEPVPAAALARFLPAWQQAGQPPAGAGAAPGTRAGRRPAAGPDQVYEAIDQLAGAAVPASALETLILPGRVPGYQPAMLDELTAAGEIVWSGAGGLPGGDGWLVLAPADTAPLLLPAPGEITLTPLHQAVLGALDGGGGLFFRMLADRAISLLPEPERAAASDAALAAAIWDLVWAGRLSNDTLAALRTVLSTGRPAAPDDGPAAAQPGAGSAGSQPDSAGLNSAGLDGTGLNSARLDGAGLNSARLDGAGLTSGEPNGAGPNGSGIVRPSFGGGSFGGTGPRRHGTGRSSTGRPGTGRMGARRPGSGRPAMPSRTGPPTVSGRWFLVPPADPDPTRRLHAVARTLLDRHGILIRGAVASERVPGGFAAIYPVLRAMEDAGQCRRGYFVEGLGAAQFALPGAVDRMRAMAADAEQGEQADPPSQPLPGPYGDPWSRPTPGPQTDPWSRPTPGPHADPWSRAAPAQPAGSGQPGRAAGPAPVVLAAGDPANPFGAALPWPDRPDETPGGHRPGRKAGALVVLTGGHLVLYVERGGKTVLSWTSDPAVLGPAAAALAGVARSGALGRLTIERADGDSVHGSPLAQALAEAGFRATPRGLRLRR
jgi:ATP-dependent helicase Lhr and Lhr-like helicase